MRPKVMIAILGILASVALVVGLVRPGSAESDGEDGGGVVRAGNAVVEGADARIEGGPSVEGDKASVGEGESGSDEDESTNDEANEKGSASLGEGEVLLRMKGDEGVEFSGACSVGGEEEEMEGQVPEEFTFALDGDELECEVRKEGDGTLKMVLISENDRIVQKVSGDSTMKFAYSSNGSSSSTTSISGSSNVVTQSSSSVSSSSVQLNSSSASD